MVKLRVHGVSCRYASTEVLTDVTFNIGEHDFVGVLGPNGSGKTTLLRTLSRVLKPHQGAVLLEGVGVYQMKSVDVAKVMAVVPQETPITFNLTALDIILMGRNPHLKRLYTESEADYAAAQRAMEMTDTVNLANRAVTELSGGEKQRVIIARALAQEPKVLLLDEPTVHLDINNQIAVMEMLKRLCGERELAVLTVMHDFNMASTYCDRVILMQRGKIFSAGPPREVITAANVKEVFGVDVLAKTHPITNTLYVIPHVAAPSRQGFSSRRGTVHVICGGGSGAAVMRMLVDAGYNVTAGVLNLLDTDWEVAEALGIPLVSEAPFSPITQGAHESNLRMMEQADVVIVAAAPFGTGNLRNFETVSEALRRQKPVILIEETPITQRDYTNGLAQHQIEKFKQSGALTAETSVQALTLMAQVMQRRDGSNETYDSPGSISQRDL